MCRLEMPCAIVDRQAFEEWVAKYADVEAVDLSRLEMAVRGGRSDDAGVAVEAMTEGKRVDVA